MSESVTQVKFETAVSKGLLTYAGLAGATGQYAAAIATFLVADDKVIALGPLGTATATLLGVIAARASQAKAAIQTAAFNSTTSNTPFVGVALSRAVAGQLVTVTEDPIVVAKAAERMTEELRGARQQ